MRGLGAKVKKPKVVKKILRTLLDSYGEKASTIEEVANFNTYTRDQLYSTLTTFEMRKVGPNKGAKVENTFNARKSKKVEDSNGDDLDDVEANFIIRMKKGTSKYKGKLYFKCFSCGQIGHYASICPNRVVNNKSKENKGKMMMNLIMKMLMIIIFCSWL